MTHYPEILSGLDDLSRGHRENISAALNKSGHAEAFTFIEGSITDIDTCREAVNGCEFVLHHAALASVPESLADPVNYHAVNVTGFMNVLQAAHEHNVKRVVYASSSAVYGDDETMPKVEGITGKTLSPYALNKYVNELYAEFFTRVYGLECAGLRYFNVFGPRQDPNGEAPGRVFNVGCRVRTSLNDRRYIALFSVDRTRTKSPEIFSVSVPRGGTKHHK